MTGSIEAPPSASSRASSRTRMTIERFSAGPSTPKETLDVLQYGQGKGQALGELPNVAFILQKKSSTQEVIVGLHRLFYGTAGKQTTRKKHLRAFQGFHFNDKFTREKVIERLSDRKWTMVLLKEACEILDLEKSGDKATIVERIIEFLMKPESSGKSDKKRKTKDKSTSRTKKAKKDRAPRALSAFFIFSKEKRPAVKLKHPDFDIKQVASELGKQWQALTDEEKKPYLAQHEAEKKKLRQLQQPASESATESEDNDDAEAKEQDSKDE